MRFLCYDCNKDTWNVNQGRRFPKCGVCGGSAVEIIHQAPQTNVNASEENPQPQQQHEQANS